MRKRKTVLATATATALVAAALVTAGPAQASPSADPPRPSPNQLVYPHGYRGIAVRGGPTKTHNRPGDLLGVRSGAKRLPTVSTHATTTDTHTVTVDALDRNGNTPLTADAEYVFFQSLDGKTFAYGQLENGHFTAQLAPGTYVVEAGVQTPEPGGGKSLTIVYLPRLVLDQDRTVALDARAGRRMSINADRPHARPTSGEGGGGYARVVQDIGGEATTTAGVLLLNDWPTYITPSGPAPGLKLLFQGRLTKDGAVTGSPYIYNVAGSASDQEVIPADPALRVRTADLATVNTRYARQGRPGCAGTHAGAYLPGGGFTTGFYVGIGALPATRTEYFSPGFDWETDTFIGPSDCGFAEVSTLGTVENFPRAGTYTRERTAGPLGPGADYNSVLSDGRVQFWVPMLSSWNASSGIAPFHRVTGQTTLQAADGKVIATSDQPGYGEFNLPTPRQAAYKVTTDAARQAPWSDLATRQHIVWTFTAQRPSSDWAPLPLLSVLYRTRLDDDNRAPVGTQLVELSVRTNQDAPAPTVRRLTLRVSYDDGVTWADAPARLTTNGWQATVRNPQGVEGKYVSLRTFAEDTTGRTVDQTLIHAYGLAP